MCKIIYHLKDKIPVLVTPPETTSKAMDHVCAGHRLLSQQSHPPSPLAIKEVDSLIALHIINILSSNMA